MVKMSHKRNLLNMITIIVFVCQNWDPSDGARVRKSGNVESRTIQLSSLFPSSSSPCVLSSKVSNMKSTLHVAHRQGPCSHLSRGKAVRIDHAEILRHDQARINSIQSKLSKKPTDRFSQSQSTKLPAKDGYLLGSGNYVVTVGIGTPKKDLSLIFDTGSDMTWTQCQPCLGSCYPQKEPKFNPSSSSSYSNVSCSSPLCTSLSSQGKSRKLCYASNCAYARGYGDGSFTVGLLAKEKFTISTSDVFDGVNFGCGEDNEGLFYGAAGLLGLSRGAFSFPSQTKKTYNNIFSYCLPSSPSYTGYLTFGSAGISNSVKYTPISSFRSEFFYGITIEGITVGDQKLEIPLTVFSTPGAIIDSGTVFTYLPPKAYEPLRTKFKEHMSNYKTSSGKSDTCYDFTGLETVKIPRVSFSFSGGTVVEVETLYPFSISEVCLAFKGNAKDDDIVIFGNVPQQTLQVVYDGPGGRIGFAPNGCD